MLRRLQFSSNLTVAIKAAELLEGKLREDEVFGAFLTAVLKNDFADAWMRADEKNKTALECKYSVIGKFVFIKPNKSGYETGQQYYLKLTTTNGYLVVTPTVESDTQELRMTMKEFTETFTPAVMAY